MIIPVILCGGIGSRLWPLSTNAHPKQFLRFKNHLNYLQTTAVRVSEAHCFKQPVIVCNSEHHLKVKHSLQEIGISPLAIILEPEGRGTAPAIAAAAHVINAHNLKYPMLILPCDHFIHEEEVFIQAVKDATILAEEHLLLFGIRPYKPETSYGYIEKAQKITGFNIYKMAKFIEKPDIRTSRQLLETDKYLWNSGIYLSRPDCFLSELSIFEPDIVNHTYEAFRSSICIDYAISLNAKNFTQCKNISLDNAVMERTNNAAVMPIEIQWSDIGTWPAIHEFSPKDQDANSCYGNVIIQDSRNCLIHSDKILTAVVGIENVTVVSTAESVLVTSHDKSEQIKEIITKFNTYNNNSAGLLKREDKPWGHYVYLIEEENFKVKKLYINPGGKLSLQYHNYRAEQWTVVQGMVRVRCGHKIFDLHERSTTYIPIKEEHRIENLSSSPAALIEIQFGNYIEEHDIVRLDDVYGRVSA